MKLEELETIEQLENFLNGTQAVIFEISLLKKERYDWVRKELVRFGYLELGRVQKGVLIRYLTKVSGCSRQQVTRLIEKYRKTGYIKHKSVNRPVFKTRYTKDDIRLLAKMGQRYDQPCGQAMKKLCERAYTVFNEVQFERLSTISVSHLYNLRKTKTYGLTRQHFQKTQSRVSTIGERCKPRPNGRPGYIRIDTVQIFQQLGQELPYTSAVQVEQYEKTATLHKVSVMIWIDRDSHKPIFLGKDGSRLKKIGTRARFEMENLLGAKVYLQLWVKVKQGWADSDLSLRTLGYLEE